MRSFGFWLGASLLILAAAAGFAQAMAMMRGVGQTVSIGSIWAGIDANSLVGLQSGIENRLAPALWPPLQAVLVWPAWATLGILGLVLVLICRRRGERRL